jgi:hypothetical protein
MNRNTEHYIYCTGTGIYYIGFVFYLSFRGVIAGHFVMSLHEVEVEVEALWSFWKL